MSKINKSNILTSKMEKFLVDKGIENAQKRFDYSKKNLSPSQDFTCQKRAFLAIKQSGPKALPINEKDFSAANEIAKDMGNNYHSQIQNYFSQMGITSLNETPFQDTVLKISARIDNLLEIDNELYLVEIKSVKNYKMHLMLQEGCPDIEHIKQIQSYFHLMELNKDREDLLEILKGRIISRGILLYINKDNQKLLEFAVDKDQKVIDEIKRYAKFVWDTVENNEIPITPFEPEDYICTYCPFYQMCHGKPKPIEKLIDNGTWGFNNAQESSKEPKFR